MKWSPKPVNASLQKDGWFGILLIRETSKCLSFQQNKRFNGRSPLRYAWALVYLCNAVNWFKPRNCSPKNLRYMSPRAWLLLASKLMPKKTESANTKRMKEMPRALSSQRVQVYSRRGIGRQTRPLGSDVWVLFGPFLYLQLSHEFYSHILNNASSLGWVLVTILSGELKFNGCNSVVPFPFFP